MKDFFKRYMRIGMLFVGILLLAFYGWKAFDLRINEPTPAEISDQMTPAEVQSANQAFESERTKWNNQFARKGFFALIGLFLALLMVLPKKRQAMAKIVFSSGLVALIIHHLLADGKITNIVKDGQFLENLSLFWILMAFVVKASGMGCTVWRWKVLLDGQGFKIPLRHLIESFLIGRFIGSFAPGTSGLDGYRAYDTSRYTGKVARAISVIFVEKLIGFFVLGTLLLVAVPIGQSLFSEHNVNATALIMMGIVFSGMMLASLIVLFKPALIRWILAKFIPRGSPLRRPFNKVLRAVTAYEKRKLHLLKATLVGFGVHLCTIGMYFCTARAIGEFPPTNVLFVTGAIMIGATVLPLSIAGIGMREGVFAFFLGPIAAIYAFGGYLVGEIISLLGGPVWLARRSDYYEVIKTKQDAINAGVDDDEDDEEFHVSDQPIPTGPPPSVREYTRSGLGAGLIAGLGVAIVDAVRLWFIAGSVDMSLPGYGALLYGPLLALLGAAFGGAMAILGRWVQKPAAPKRYVTTTVGLTLFFVFVFAIGFFFLHRDVFEEKASLFSPRMLGAVAGLAVGLIAFCLGVCFAIRKLFVGKKERLVNAAYAAVLYVILTGILVVLWFSTGATEKALGEATEPKTAAAAPNIVLVMNDTHRADYVGAYGAKENLTPNLDTLAEEGVVFTNAFAQASWTRPSVSTILTGRYPSSHTATLKGSILPDEVTTVAEVLQQGGYETIGIATNYNMTPFFNVDQGFDDYKYLTPNLPLGATDIQSKLIFVEVLKKIQAKLRGRKEVPDDYYVIGEIVTEKALHRLDKRDPSRPFFMFLSYMDVHDPYFRHPFDGYGISHRANPNPDPSMIPEMKKLYAGEVKYWDRCFGDFIAGLKARKLYDDTLIVVTSDHGEEFGEHGGFWHGTTLYDEQLRILFIAKYPLSVGIAGAVVPDWMRLLDVAPFITEIAGLEIPDEWQGSPSPNGKRPVFAEEDHEGNILSSIQYVTETGKETKLIKANENNPRKLEPFELYHTDEDPAETQNLAKASTSRALLIESVELLDRYSEKAQQGAAAAKSTKLDSETKEVLKRLGYMGDDNENK
ncbi:MAG: sulfatase-like hydrolase/transferase [Proteobacteria bacterium]|nr:sulfatase-like hydrolase/transferase [Pseudomonadota bacterium]